VKPPKAYFVPENGSVPLALPLPVYQSERSPRVPPMMARIAEDGSGTAVRVNEPVAPSLTLAVFVAESTVTPVVEKLRMPPAKKGLKSKPWIVFDSSTALITKPGFPALNCQFNGLGAKRSKIAL
jgi:hypothetical protein